MKAPARRRVDVMHYYPDTRVGKSCRNARWRYEVSYWSKCKTCRGTGEGSGCHEQGGWTNGLCPDCCGFGGGYSNSKPLGNGRWRKGPSPLFEEES